MFFWASFIENWGQDIRKICDECKKIGAELPVYELTGTTLRLRLKALESALIEDSKVPKDQNGPLDVPLENLLEKWIIKQLQQDPKITHDQLSAILQVSRSSIKRSISRLIEKVKVSRVGGKRYD